ncbi:hypothetical protein D6C95_00465 [Aureobasidium pullulans]|nr:hypothetical protein D6C95_00465 [Aureobasidium pullulans]
MDGPSSDVYLNPATIGAAERPSYQKSGFSLDTGIDLGSQPLGRLVDRHLDISFFGTDAAAHTRRSVGCVARPGAVASTLHDLLRESVSHMRARWNSRVLLLFCTLNLPPGAL